MKLNLTMKLLNIITKWKINLKLIKLQFDCYVYMCFELDFWGNVLFMDDYSIVNIIIIIITIIINY